MVLDRKEIEKQAKEILDKFANTLEKVEREHDLDSYLDREEFEREEGMERKKVEGSFKNKILSNSPSHDDEVILTEKGSWK